jgi:hypothetical protein
MPRAWKPAAQTEMAPTLRPACDAGPEGAEALSEMDAASRRSSLLSSLAVPGSRVSLHLDSSVHGARTHMPTARGSAMQRGVRRQQICTWTCSPADLSVCAWPLSGRGMSDA